MTTTRANWFESFFEGVANDLWRKCMSPEQTRAEADFLEKVLGGKSRLLDVPCGNGRHALELARRGCRVTGVDISTEFVQEATRAAAAEQLNVEFLQGDMRRLKWEAEFDGAYCFGNSFGYLEFPDMILFLRSLARALKPGARFVIQTGSVAETLLPNLEERVWYQVEDILFAISNKYLAAESCLETETTFVRNGKTEVRKFWHWVYTVGELRRMLAEAGLKTIELYGSTDMQPFALGSHYLHLVAQKQ